MFLVDLGDAAAIVSAFAALVALVVSIYVEIRTRRLLEPIERPVISLSGHPEVEAKLLDQPPRVRMLVMFIFKNIGKHPAHNLRFRVGLVEEGRWAEFRVISDAKLVNSIDPGQEFNWSLDFSQDVHVQQQRVQLNPITVYFYLLANYEDALVPRKRFSWEFWASYRTGHRGAGQVTALEKQTLEPYVRLALGD